jgi:hypothetical protein
VSQSAWLRTSKLDSAESSGGEKEDRGDECKGAFDYDAHQAKGQQAQPDKRIEDEGKERERPADHEEEAKEQEFEHDVSGCAR